MKGKYGHSIDGLIVEADREGNKELAGLIETAAERGIDAAALRRELSALGLPGSLARTIFWEVADYLDAAKTEAGEKDAAGTVFDIMVESAEAFIKGEGVTGERLDMWPTSFFEDWSSDFAPYKAWNAALTRLG